jgi:CubicO group peptidase (beta-lactamase class C family)
MIRAFLIGTAVALSLSAAPAAQAVTAEPVNAERLVDTLFTGWTSSTPGCAVGVAVGGKPVLLKAYGMADLEHDVRNTPETIFESGSVAKQFTALAVQLLAGDGKLSLDDPVRKFIPELPDYKAPLTIRHMLNHTSGLRDWGSVASIAGSPRTTREYTHGHVLDIAARQKSLNFEPGSKWSYSNTGFNLSAIIVARVSGMSFAQFSKDRIFTPLGMTKTSWRDDHTRIVKGRAIAYARQDGEYHIEMPFENVHGNGGLLTTVGDLLIWNENFVNPKVGSAKLLGEMAAAGHFNDGKPLEYGLGLYVQNYRGLANINHSGSTAGYRAHLNRFPKSHTSVAVLCNGSDGAATRSANLVSEIFLGLERSAPPVAGQNSDTPETGKPMPSNADMAAYAGDFWSGEAETMLTVTVDRGLILRRRPDSAIGLTPLGGDQFRGSIGTVTFRRNAAGVIEALSIRQDRVWDLRFVKQ